MGNGDSSFLKKLLNTQFLRDKIGLSRQHVLLGVVWCVLSTVPFPRRFIGLVPGARPDFLAGEHFLRGFMGCYASRFPRT